MTFSDQNSIVDAEPQTAPTSPLKHQPIDIGADHGPAPSANASVIAYLRTKVMSASPEELRMMLLDGAIKFGRQGRDGMVRKDFEAQYNGISQCRNIIFELLSTVRSEPSPELAGRVKALYTFLYTSLTEASFEKDLKKLDKVIELLEFERETWAMLMQKLSAERARGAKAAATANAPGTKKAEISISG